MAKNIQNFLDTDGRLKQLPSKQLMKDLAHAYLAEKFDYDTEYSEQDVNAIISQWHSFGDYFVLRRGLVESGWLNRTPNGSIYWKNKEKQELLNEAE